MVEPAHPVSAGDDNDDNGSDNDDDTGAAPVRRPRIRALAQQSSTLSVELGAHVLRAILGAAAFCGALLLIPITFATPVLAGISMLMMVTGCTGTSGVLRNRPSSRRIGHVVIGACAAVVVVTLILVGVWGAGAFAPHTQTVSSDLGDGTIRFEPPASR